MPLTLTPRDDEAVRDSVLDQLERLRRRLRLVTVFREGSLVVLLALVLVASIVWLDWRYHLPSLVRAVGLASILVGITLLTLRWIILPWHRSRSLLMLASQIEKQYPHLHDSLVSAVQFLELPNEDTDHGSPLLRRETIDQATEDIAELDLTTVMPTRGTFTAIVLLAGAIGGACYLYDANPDATETALSRLAFPYAKSTFPTKTTLRLTAPHPLPYRMARGDTLEIQAVIGGVVPERARIEIVLEGAKPNEQVYAIPRPDPTTGESILLVRIDGQRLPRDFQFRVRAGDADTGLQAVTVHPAPMLVPLDGLPSPQLRLTYPAYTELHPVEHSDGTGVIEAIAGTEVWLRAATDRPITLAKLTFLSEHPRFLASAMLAPLGSQHLVGTAGSSLMSREYGKEITLSLNAEGRIMETIFVPRLSGTYVLRFEDSLGIGNERRFTFRVQPDPAPMVAMLRPSAARDSLALLPTASVTLQSLAIDKVFALKRVDLEYRTSKSTAPRSVPMFEDEFARNLLPHLARWMPMPLTFPVEKLGKFKVFGTSQRLSLSQFRHPDGSPLKEGDVLILQVAATDFDDVNLVKGPGRSHEIELQIVSRPHLDTLMQQGISQIRNDLLRMREMQHDARAKVREATKQLQASGQLRPQDLEALRQAEQLQQQIRSRVTAPEDGLLNEAARWKQAVEDNQLPRSKLTDRLDSAESEMRRLALEELEPIEENLGTARREQEQPEAEKTPVGPKHPLAKAERGQKEVEDTLKSLLERLEPWSAAGEVRGEARSLLNELERLTEQVRQVQEKQPASASGMPRESLTPEQRSELDRTAVRPERFADRARQMIEKMERMIADKQSAVREELDRLQEQQTEAKRLEKEAAALPEGSPERKNAERVATEAKDRAADTQQRVEALQAEQESLRRALDAADSQAMKQQLQKVAEQVRENELPSAQAAQKKAAAELEKLIAGLEEKTKSEDMDLLAKKTRGADRDLQKLTEKQELLQKKINAAEKIADPEERKTELQKLAREQEELRRETEELAQRLTRAQAEPVASELRRAARRMDDARQQLEQGDSPEKLPEEILDRLDDAQDNLEKKQQQDDDDLLREKLMKAAEQIKAIRDRQQTAIEEAKRLHGLVIKDGGWANVRTGPVLRTNLNNLRDQQEALIKEVESLVEKRFQQTPVFERMLKQSAEAMTLASARLKKQRDNALDQVDGLADFRKEEEDQASIGVQSMQQLALKRLDQLLEALKPDREMMQQARKPENQPKEADPPKTRDSDDLPPLAQLKALRELQSDLAERTANFDRVHPDRTKLTDDESAELETLQRAQLDVAELVRTVIPMPMPGDKP